VALERGNTAGERNRGPDQKGTGRAKVKTKMKEGKTKSQKKERITRVMSRVKKARTKGEKKRRGVMAWNTHYNTGKESVDRPG